MILWLIERARLLDLPYVYLGFWVHNCAKMSYKANFQPIEAFTAEGWRPLEDVQREAACPSQHLA
jgi:arginine-tRNA-protein transferase